MRYQKPSPREVPLGLLSTRRLDLKERVSWNRSTNYPTAWASSFARGCVSEDLSFFCLLPLPDLFEHAHRVGQLGVEITAKDIENFDESGISQRIENLVSHLPIHQNHPGPQNRKML